MSRLLLPTLMLIALIAGGLTYAPAQKALRPTVYAIRDVRAVTKAGGKVEDKVTVVIRDGLIEDIGPSVKVPTDAIVIDGTGKTIYPGFIDGLTNQGFDASQRKSAVGEPAVEDLEISPSPRSFSR